MYEPLKTLPHTLHFREYSLTLFCYLQSVHPHVQIFALVAQLCKCVLTGHGLLRTLFMAPGRKFTLRLCNTLESLEVLS